MSAETNKKQFMITAGAQGFYGDEVETLVANIVKLIPDASRAEYEDDYAAAIANFDVYLKANGKGDGGAPAPGTGKQVVGTSSASAITSEQQKAIVDGVQASMSSKLEMSAKSSVDKVTFDKPAPNAYIDPKTMVVLDKALAAKIKKYAPEDAVGHIDPNDTASVEAYNKLLAAIEAGEKVQVHVSDKMSSPNGVVLTKPAVGEGKSGNVTVSINKKHLIGFLSKEAYAHVPTGPSGLGAKLSVATKKDKNNPSAQPTLGTPNVKITGVNDALKDKTKFVIISEKDGTRTKDGSVSTELSFKIKTDRKNKAQETVYRTVRLRSVIKVPIWKRISDELLQEFGTGNKDASIVAGPVTPEETQNYANLIVKSQQAFLQNPSTAVAYGVKETVDAIANVAAGGGKAQEATEL